MMYTDKKHRAYKIFAMEGSRSEASSALRPARFQPEELEAEAVIPNLPRSRSCYDWILPRNFKMIHNIVVTLASSFEISKFAPNSLQSMKTNPDVMSSRKFRRSAASSTSKWPAKMSSWRRPSWPGRTTRWPRSWRQPWGQAPSSQQKRCLASELLTFVFGRHAVSCHCQFFFFFFLGSGQRPPYLYFHTRYLIHYLYCHITVVTYTLTQANFLNIFLEADWGW